MRQFFKRDKLGSSKAWGLSCFAIVLLFFCVGSETPLAFADSVSGSLTLRHRTHLTLGLKDCELIVSGVAQDRLEWVTSPGVRFFHREEGGGLDLSIRREKGDPQNTQRCLVKLKAPRVSPLRVLGSGTTRLNLTDWVGPIDIRMDSGALDLSRVGAPQTLLRIYCRQCEFAGEQFEGKSEIHVTEGSITLRESALDSLSLSVDQGRAQLLKVTGDLQVQVTHGGLALEKVAGMVSYLTRTASVQLSQGKGPIQLQGLSETGPQELRLLPDRTRASSLQSRSGKIEVSFMGQPELAMRLRVPNSINFIESPNSLASALNWRPEESSGFLRRIAVLVPIPYRPLSAQSDPSRPECSLRTWSNRSGLRSVDLEIDSPTGQIGFHILAESVYQP